MPAPPFMVCTLCGARVTPVEVTEGFYDCDVPCPQCQGESWQLHFGDGDGDAFPCPGLTFDPPIGLA